MKKDAQKGSEEVSGVCSKCGLHHDLINEMGDAWTNEWPELTKTVQLCRIATALEFIGKEFTIDVVAKEILEGN